MRTHEISLRAPRRPTDSSVQRNFFSPACVRASRIFPEKFFAVTVLIINSKYHTLWAMGGDIVHFENAMKKINGPQRTFSSAFVFSAATERAPADVKFKFRHHHSRHSLPGGGESAFGPIAAPSRRVMGSDA
jgi:hypothetical protein